MRKGLRKLWNNGAVWSAIAVIINSAMNFLIIPIVSERIGIEAYGYVTLANTLITYIDVISLAINSFASRYIAIEYHNKKINNAKEYYCSVYFANCILSGMLLLLMLVFVPNIQLFLVVSNNIVSDVKLLFVIVFIRYIFVLLRSVFEVSAFIKNKIYLTERMRSYSYIIQGILLVYTCIIIPAKIWYVAVASAVAALFMLIAEIIIARKNTPELSLSVSCFSGKKLRTVLASGVWNSINNLGNLLNSGLDLLITNKMLTELALGMISVSKTFGSMCYILANAISNAFKPKQLELYSKNNIEGLVGNLKKSMKITGSICNIIIVCFLCCGKEFLSLWIPSQDINSIYVLSVIVLFGDIVTGVVNPLFYCYTLANKVKLPCLITITMGTVNVLSMYILIKYTSLGMYAVVLTTVILNCIHFIDTPIYSAYCLKIPYKSFYPTILLHFISLSVLSTVMLGINYLYPTAHTWCSLLVKGFLFFILSTGLSFIIVFNKDERNRVLKKVFKSKT